MLATNSDERASAPSRTDGAFQTAISKHVWRTKYRRKRGEHPESSITDTWDRVAAALAAPESEDRERWNRLFRRVLQDFQFLPAGRILAGAGTTHRATLFNCFVMDFIEDSLEGICEQLKRGAQTMQWGGGIGCDFSTLRPYGAEASGAGTLASGPVSFMRVWDAMCATLLSTGARRGAMMGTLRCDHPDIEAFIDAKREPGALTNFNLSVQITDEFMAAAVENETFPLCFPMQDGDSGKSQDVKLIHWPGRSEAVPCRIFKTVPAGQLWQRIMATAYEVAEPGVLFVDRINRLNNLHYCEHLTSTNPCGEVPLPPYGACNLGSINLVSFVDAPFSRRAGLKLGDLAQTAAVTTRLLDNVIDVSKYPLPQQAEQAAASRRIGLGITGLGDALAMLGHRYDSEAARGIAQTALRTIRDAAYCTSIELAAEKGSFPLFERAPYLDGAYTGTLPDDIRDGIARCGIRNSHLLSIAPAGTISLLANNISNGIEPIFALEAQRRILNAAGEFESHRVVDRAFSLWREQNPSAVSVPEQFVTAHELAPEAHLAMQAALQPLVDQSISKTINVPEDISPQDFGSIYRRAFELGLKGCTVFRPNPVTGAVLAPARIQCCAPEREGD